MTVRSMRETFAQDRRGSEVDKGSPGLPGGPAQLPLGYDPIVEQESAEADLRVQFRSWVNAFGGPDALRAALHKPSSYLSKMSEAMTGKRPIQACWIEVLARDAKSGPLVAAYYARLAEADEPALTRAEIAEENLQLTMESPHVWRAHREEIARRRRVPVDRVRA